MMFTILTDILGCEMPIQKPVVNFPNGIEIMIFWQSIFL